jgi:hypothetical protein
MSSYAQLNYYSIVCTLRWSNNSRLDKVRVHNLPFRLVKIRAESESWVSAGIAELAPTSWFSASWTTGVALHPPWFSGDMGSPTVSLDREVSNLWSSWRNAFTH